MAEPTRHLPGFRDWQPEKFAWRNHFHKTCSRAARNFGFQQYDGPTLEALELYTQKSGEEIKQQLFHFTDKGDRAVALRPEMTPSFTRMVKAQIRSSRFPLKWFSIGEFYRYERQQKGRLRAFDQFNADIVSPNAEALQGESIGLLVATLKAFGLDASQVQVHLSHRELWANFLKILLAGQGAKIQTHCEATAQSEAEAKRKNKSRCEAEAPARCEDTTILKLLSIIDKSSRCKTEATLKRIEELPIAEPEKLLEAIENFKKLESLEAIRHCISAHKDAPSRSHAAKLHRALDSFERTVQGLEAIGIGSWIKIDLAIVRGLAYYKGLVFEAFGPEVRALCGGGGYVVEQDSKLAGFGFALGDVPLHALLKAQGKLPELSCKPDIFVFFPLQAAKNNAALKQIQALRESGIHADYKLENSERNSEHSEQAETKTMASEASMLKMARKAGAGFALIHDGKSKSTLVDLKTKTSLEIPSDEELVAKVKEQMQAR